MVVPLVLAFRQKRALGVEVEAGFCKDRYAFARKFSQAIHAFLQEFRVVDNLVVVQEHHGIEAHDVGERETMSCTLSAACASVDWSAATSTMIWPMPRTFCSDVSKRGSSPGFFSGVV